MFFSESLGAHVNKAITLYKPWRLDAPGSEHNTAGIGVEDDRQALRRRGIIPALHWLRESRPEMFFDLRGLYGDGISTAHIFRVRFLHERAMHDDLSTSTGVRTYTILGIMPTFETYKNKILRFYRQHRRMPSYGEIMCLVGFKSKFAVVKLVSKLVTAGIVAKDAGGRLIPQKLTGAILVLGIVEAGWPSPAEEELMDTMNLDGFLGNNEATYMLEVSNDSMIDAGIMPGDLVLVERGIDPKDGDIIIAEVDGGWTIKYLRKRGKEVMLIPGNKKYKPIVPTSQLNVAAIVKAVIRKYR